MALGLELLTLFLFGSSGPSALFRSPGSLFRLLRPLLGLLDRSGSPGLLLSVPSLGQ